MNKRLLAALLALCMALALLSACGEKQAPEEGAPAPLPQEQETPAEPEALPQEQETPTQGQEPEAPPVDGAVYAPEDAAPLEPYAEVCFSYPNYDLFSNAPYVVRKGLFDPDDIRTFRYESNIIFEGSEELAERLLEEGKNPGLGVRGLHEQGITGEGVNVAIIDQNLLLDHPEYAGCIADYYDSGCRVEGGSMHAPAVLSILAGKTLGVALGAKVYYAAAPAWEADAAYYADCLYWIIEQNEALPEGEKIRVVSVSAAPMSWPGGGGFINGEQWTEAVAAAEEAGILVMDARETEETCFVSRSYCSTGPCDDVEQYDIYFAPDNVQEVIFAPASFRTTAQEYREGNYIYTYWGDGGVSWSIPYVAGVLALGWQVNPELDAQTAKELLFESAWVNERGCRMIDPPAFIELVRGTAE